MYTEYAGTRSGASDVAVIAGLLWIQMDVTAQVPAGIEEQIQLLDTLYAQKNEHIRQIAHAPNAIEHEQIN